MYILQVHNLVEIYKNILTKAGNKEQKNNIVAN